MLFVNTSKIKASLLQNVLPSKKNMKLLKKNTILLTFNTITVPKSLKIFYRIIPVTMYVPNPLRCFNCQRFEHHEGDCPVDYASVCEKCGTGGFDHLESKCPNQVKCVNCGLNHLSRSNVCEVWKKEKEIMGVKVTNNITYIEARKMVEQKPEVTLSTIIQSATRKPETKTVSTKVDANDKVITSSTKVLTGRKKNQIKIKINLKLQHPSLKQLHQHQNQVHHKLNQQKTGNHGQKIKQAQERKANLQRKIKEIKSN